MLHYFQFLFYLYHQYTKHTQQKMKQDHKLTNKCICTTTPVVNTVKNTEKKQTKLLRHKTNKKPPKRLESTYRLQTSTKDYVIKQFHFIWL